MTDLEGENKFLRLENQRLNETIVFMRQSLSIADRKIKALQDERNNLQRTIRLMKKIASELQLVFGRDQSSDATEEG